MATTRFRIQSGDQQSPSGTPQVPFCSRSQQGPASIPVFAEAPQCQAHLAPHVSFQAFVCFHKFSLPFKTIWKTYKHPTLSGMDQSRCLNRNSLSSSSQFLLISLKTSLFEFSFRTEKIYKSSFYKNCSWKNNLKSLSYIVSHFLPSQRQWKWQIQQEGICWNTLQRKIVLSRISSSICFAMKLHA